MEDNNLSIPNTYQTADQPTPVADDEQPAATVDMATDVAPAAPSVDEFMAWTDQDETAAIEAARESYTVRHVMKNGEYWALLPGGRVYKLPLALSIDDFDRLGNAANDTESIQALRVLLETFGGREQATLLAKEPVQAVMNMLTDYGDVIARTQGASLGK